MNPPRTLMVSVANGIAVICFVIAGAVQWLPTVVMGVGALIGGYGGAHIGKRLPPLVVRTATVLLAVAMTLIFFARAYL
jgi:uncharacterized membrane protein YfcA